MHHALLIAHCSPLTTHHLRIGTRAAIREVGFNITQPTRPWFFNFSAAPPELLAKKVESRQSVEVVSSEKCMRSEVGSGEWWVVNNEQ